MKKVRVLHNAKAGDEDHSADDMVNLIQSEGFVCEYFPIKSSKWYKISSDVDFLAIAGGDGTIRKVVKKLLDRKLIEKRYPIGIVPLGTANNMANTLGLSRAMPEIVSSWKKPTMKKFDIGLIEGMNDERFFLEALGYGVFPELMSRMKKVDEKYKDSPEKKLEAALKILQEITESCNPDSFIIEADDVSYSGKYFLAEVMNTKSIGPNLNLSPDNDPGDGFFDLVLISEDNKEKLKEYLLHKVRGEELPVDFNPIKCREIIIGCDCKKLHIDDELIKLKEATALHIYMQENVFQFLI